MAKTGVLAGFDNEVSEVTLTESDDASEVVAEPELVEEVVADSEVVEDTEEETEGT